LIQLLLGWQLWTCKLAGFFSSQLRRCDLATEEKQGAWHNFTTRNHANLHFWCFLRLYLVAIKVVLSKKWSNYKDTLQISIVYHVSGLNESNVAFIFIIQFSSLEFTYKLKTYYFDMGQIWLYWVHWDSSYMGGKNSEVWSIFKEVLMTKNGPINFAQSWAIHMKKSN
jgi:hypothetical protein